MNVDFSSIRVRLAAAEGWYAFGWYDDSSGPPILTAAPPRDYPLKYGRPDTTVPHYERDLEQARRLEFKMVSDAEYDVYIQHLKAVCENTVGLDLVGLVANVARVNRYACASAEQRCHALVRFLHATGKMRKE